MVNDFTNGASTETVDSLRLPHQFDDNTYTEAINLDTFLRQPDQPADTLAAKLEASQKASLLHLSKLNGKQVFDTKSPSPLSRLFSLFRSGTAPFSRKPSLYLPQNTNPSDYGAILFPEDRRYSHDWVFPVAAGNRASRLDGSLACFSKIDNSNVQPIQSSESGVGILYKPSIVLGDVELQPQVDCSGFFNTFVDLTFIGGGGSVWVNAELLLAMWEQVASGFQFLSFKRFDVATSGRRDATFPAEQQQFQKSFNGSDLSASFRVQGGRTYLFGVVSRISIISGLFMVSRQPLPPISPDMLSVYGSMTSKVPQINVLRQRIFA